MSVHCTHIHDLHAFAGLTEPHDAVKEDAGPILAAVLHKAEGLKREAGYLGDAVLVHNRPWVQMTTTQDRTR